MCLSSADAADDHANLNTRSAHLILGTKRAASRRPLLYIINVRYLQYGECPCVLMTWRQQRCTARRKVKLCMSKSKRPMPAPLRVAVRVRPWLKRDGRSGVDTACTADGVLVNGVEQFSFRSSFGPEATQQSVYDFCAAPHVAAVLTGLDACVLAFGQTGTRKTFSMIGPDGGGSMQDDGILPLAASEIFRGVAKLVANRTATPPYDNWNKVVHKNDKHVGYDFYKNELLCGVGFTLDNPHLRGQIHFLHEGIKLSHGVRRHPPTSRHDRFL